MANKLSVFPNTEIKGQYDSLTQTIEYSALSRNQFDAALANPFSHKHIQNARLIVHEACHYVDHIATLTGQSLLANTFDAYNAKKSANESEFWRMMKLYKSIQGFKYSRYYKEAYNDAKGGVPTDWSFSSSIGCRFDANGKVDETKPVVFNRFLYKGTQIARIPFSVEALWEINAMSLELITYEKMVMGLDDDSKVVENSLLLSDSLEWIYNSELLTYSSAAHLVSSYLNISDILLAFDVARCISLICLNMPSKYYSRVKIPRTLTLPKSRVKGFQLSRDPSCLFYIFVKNVQEGIHQVGIPITGRLDEDAVDALLMLNGLPGRKAIAYDVEREMSLMARNVMDGPHSDDYKILHKKGMEIFKTSGIDGLSLDPEFYFNIVRDGPVICNDEIDGPVSDRWMEYSTLGDRIIDFASGCGY